MNMNDSMMQGKEEYTLDKGIEIWELLEVLVDESTQHILPQQLLNPHETFFRGCGPLLHVLLD